MFSKALIALAAACLAGQTVAGPHHQHGMQHAHEKRAMVTELVTVTNWVTVTVGRSQAKTKGKVHYTRTRKVRPTAISTLTSSSTTAPAAVSEAAAPPPPSTEAASIPTTIVTRVRPVSEVAESIAPIEAPKSEPAVQPPPPVVPTSPPVVSVTAPAPGPSIKAVQADPAPAPAPETGSGNSFSGRRGVSYNNPAYLQRFLNAGSKISWCYNWGQRDDSGVNIPFIPTLWGLKLDFAQTWPANAQEAINKGSPALFSFNEPDHAAQANLSPQVAAQKHIELMNPFSGKARIASPSITNSGNPGEGIEWLKQFFDACGGNCAVDFVNIHIYGFDTETFLAHLIKVHELFQKPVWITEFAFGGSESEINNQLATVLKAIEGDAKYNFVEHYAYFMAEEGMLVKGNSLSTYGQTYAYSA
ncbi:glycosyl hydrolase catalytic core-domain-containing protein [Cladorrhinum samala]|uniref:Glycosyl hydrolase catalytic core-domain-containing protein n=1 Tax=Cladorrhinum samala TaxID=585594 RepID=A0AAV9HIY2_9PEZI|nr:glycosyl hydrolase catalytic core-domain-containing protein [Cladorrhinum samala]